MKEGKIEVFKITHMTTSARVRCPHCGELTILNIGQVLNRGGTNHKCHFCDGEMLTPRSEYERYLEPVKHLIT